MTEKKLQDFKANLEKRLVEKFEKQKLYLGFQFVPSAAPGEFKLEIFDKKRPPTQFGSSQGAHTVAYSAVLKSLQWMLEDVTMSKARERLIDFHWDLYATYILCVNDPLKPDYLDRLKMLADDVHGEMRDEYKARKDAAKLVTDYLTLFMYLHNLFPEAAVNLPSINRGESAALKNLKKLNEGLGTTPNDKAKAIACLSVLIDEEAIDVALRKSKNLGTSLVGFQLLGVSRMLKGLPNLSKVAFGGDLSSPALKERMNENGFIDDLVKIVFYKFRDGQEVLSKSADPEKAAHVKEALQWIYSLRHVVKCEAPYGIIARA